MELHIPSIQKHMTAQLRRDLLTHQSYLITVISELLAEADNMKARKLPDHLIAAKRHQVDVLATLNNTMDDLVNIQQMQLLQLRIENFELWKLLDRCIQSQQISDELLKYVHENRNSGK